MLRYLLPAVVLVTALLALFAGAFGNLNSRPPLQNAPVPVVGNPPSAPPPSKARSATITPAPQQHDALKAQVDDLQNDVAEATRQLSSLRASEASERQALDALRKQHHDLEASLARLKTQQREASVAVAAGPPAVGPANRQSVPPSPSPLTTLAMAKNALMRGRPDEARSQLALAETQLVLRPATPGEPVDGGGTSAATDVSDAIRWLDAGDIDQALQQVNLALASARENNGAAAAPATPLSPGYYAYRPQSTPNNSSGWHQ